MFDFMEQLTQERYFGKTLVGGDGKEYSIIHYLRCKTDSQGKTTFLFLGVEKDSTIPAVIHLLAADSTTLIE